LNWSITSLFSLVIAHLHKKQPYLGVRGGDYANRAALRLLAE
jgi:hypothetical protein